MKRMRLSCVLALCIAGLSVYAQDGPFAPAAGQPGSTAVHKDSSVFQSWATGIQVQRGLINIADPSVTDNGSNRASYGYPSFALGKAAGSSVNAVSLGDAGVATLTFDRPIVNGEGYDFAIFENSFSDTYLELGFVEVSSDGERFVRFPAISRTQDTVQVGGFGQLDPTNVYNFAGKYRQGYGTPFDLDELKDSAGIDLNHVRFVRIVDVVGNIDPQYASYDAEGNIVNDPWSNPFASGGFDLEAVGLIHTGTPYQMSTFDDLLLDNNTFWDGSDASGSFVSGVVRFPNNYETSEYGDTWSGFIYTSMRNDSVGDFSNLESAITAGGINATVDSATNYAVANVPIDWMSGEMLPLELTFTDNQWHRVGGFYVTNSTFAALTMKNGDDISKKFGEEDWFKLMVWAKGKADTVEFYLADFRSEDSTQHYIVKDWRWVDLSVLGEVDTLLFSLASSDVGAYGMNTPAYFCMDNLTVFPGSGPISSVVPVMTSLHNVRAYPNPFTSHLSVECAEGSVITLYDQLGRVVLREKVFASPHHMAAGGLQVGTYFLQVTNGVSTETLQVIKR